MAQAQAKSKTDLAIALAVEAMKWVKTTGLWILGVILIVPLAGTILGLFGMGWWFLPAPEPLTLAYISGSFWAIASR